MSLPVNQHNSANVKSVPVSESVGQSPLAQFKSSLLRLLCFAAATTNEDYFGNLALFVAC
jgi:hypothetical protein